MLQLNNIQFSYADKVVIDSVTLAIPLGSQLAVIGESGSGKSTLLKLIYGMHDLDSGEIFYNDNRILGPKFNLIPGEAYIKYLAQDFGLMPFATSGENVGQFLSNSDKKKKNQRISELLEMVGMADYIDIKPQFLSGGQQQRIAIAKVLALEPEVLLLDEPFSQIDTFRANELKRNLFAYLREKKITCIMATHDSNDVLPFTDSVAVMRNGKIVASGATEEIYKNPEFYYVAALFDDVSSIPSRYFSDTVNEDNLLLYPHQMKVSDTGTVAIVIRSYFRGSHYLVEATCGSSKVFFNSESSLNAGAIVMLALKK